MNDETAASIARYRPISLDTDVAAFARDCVLAAAPESPARAKSLLFATGKFGEFCSSIGLELIPERCLHPSVIERFIALGCSGLAPATRRTLRSNVRFVARHVLSPVPSPAPLSRDRSKAPYSDAEIAAYLALCDAQPTLARRQRLGALISLGAGAGLMGNELRYVRGSDVACRSGGVLVEVVGRRPRAVPILAPYHDRLSQAAAFAGDRYVIGGLDPARGNVTDRLVRVALATSDLPRLDTGRLRSTYLVAMAGTIGLRAFMDAAGLICSQRLGDLIASLSPPSEEEAVALLGGRR